MNARASGRWDPLLVASWHLALAIAYCLAGVSITAQPARDCWDCFWQGIPKDLLITRPLESLWHLHAQPPLYNMYGAVLIALSPERHLHWLQAIHVVLGASISAMVYGILRHLVSSRPFALAASLFLATNPTLILFEAYALYVLPTAFLTTLTVHLLCLHQTAAHDRHLIGSVAAVNALVLLWSAYHLVLVLLAIGGVAALARGKRARVVALCTAITLPSAGWYAKNAVLHGFFGASSWFGQNLYHVVSARYSPDQIQALIEARVLDPFVVERPLFSLPSSHRTPGLALRFGEALLDSNTRHNGNIIAISRIYEQNGWRLMRHDPRHYLGNAIGGYLAFTSPSSTLKAHVGANAARLGIHERLWSDLLQGAALGRALIGKPVGPVLALVIPALVLWHGFFRREPVTAAAALLVAYTTAVGCLLEAGENARFKVAVEPLLGTLVAAAVARIVPRRLALRPIRRRGEGPARSTGAS